MSLTINGHHINTLADADGSYRTPESASGAAAAAAPSLSRKELQDRKASLESEIRDKQNAAASPRPASTQLDVASPAAASAAASGDSRATKRRATPGDVTTTSTKRPREHDSR